jgi:hypothetical protein
MIVDRAGLGVGIARKADSSLTIPEPTPKSESSLFGAPGAFGAPFTQNDTLNIYRRFIKSSRVSYQELQTSTLDSEAVL